MNSPISFNFDTSVYIAPSPYGSAVLCQGEDTKSFLHRMSTQKINDLQKNEGTLNTFVDQKGRLIDVTFHLQTKEDECLLLGQKADGQALIDWLENFHFIEKIEFANLTQTSSGQLLFGDKAENILSQFLGTEVSKLAPWQFSKNNDRCAVRIYDYVSTQDRTTACYYLVDLSGNDIDIAQELKAHGAQALTSEEDNDLRVKSGIPRAPQEINDAITPLALALHDSISWSKGCYIGQEVIARMDTYDRVTKNLALCLLKTDIAISEQDVIYSGDKKVGMVTSASRLLDGMQHLLVLLRLRENEIEDAGLHFKGAHGEQSVQILKRHAAQEPHD